MAPRTRVVSQLVLTAGFLGLGLLLASGEPTASDGDVQSRWIRVPGAGADPSVGAVIKAFEKTVPKEGGTDKGSPFSVARAGDDWLLVRGSATHCDAFEKALDSRPRLAGTTVSQTVPLYFVRAPKDIRGLVMDAGEEVAPDVMVSYPSADTGRPCLTLVGPGAQVQRLRSIIAQVDAPVSAVVLRLIPVQVSGSRPRVVQEAAERARQAVDAASRLDQGYLTRVREWKQPSLQASPLADSVVRMASDVAGLYDSEPLYATLRCWVLEEFGADPRAVEWWLGDVVRRWEQDAGSRTGEAQPALTRRRLRAWLDAKRATAGKPPAGRDFLLPVELIGFLKQHGPQVTKYYGAFMAEVSLEGRGVGGQSVDLNQAAADFGSVLVESERALSRDVERVILQPLLRQLQAVLGDKTLRPPRGLTSTGCTTIEVLSGSEAHVVGSAVSFFDVSEAPKLNKELLERADATSDALEDSLGGGLGKLWGNALHLPVARLAGLGLALAEQTQSWSVLTEGAELTFTPHVLPGGQAAEVKVKAIVSHGDPGPDAATVRTSHSAVPLTRVARHEADTVLYVDTAGLFRLSSFGLSTRHPRPDYVVPVLGQLPLLGSVFRFPRNPQSAYHESMLVIHASIVPTALDVRRQTQPGGGPDTPAAPPVPE